MKAALQLRTGTANVNWPDQAKARRLGVDRIGWESIDPVIDPAQNGGTNVMEAVRNNGFTLFLFRGYWDWGGSPEGWAAAFRDDLRRLDLMPVTSGPNQHKARQCALDADLEVADSDWMLPCLKELRRLMPGRGLTWSLQPHWGGVISPALRDFINDDKMVTIAPFAYGAKMEPWSERWVVDDLLDYGIHREKILIYYASWCEYWNGFLFDLANQADRPA